MLSQRRLTAETAVAVLVPHVLVTEFVLPWLAQWMPALALGETNSVAVPSFSALRFRIVGTDLTDPGTWAYLGLVWLCFAGWVYLRQDALRAVGRELLADSDIDA